METINKRAGDMLWCDGMSPEDLGDARGKHNLDVHNEELSSTYLGFEIKKTPLERFLKEVSSEDSQVC